MTTDVLERNTGEEEMIPGPETAFQGLPGDHCSALHAPSLFDWTADSDPVETKEWLDAFRGVLETGGLDRARFLIEQLRGLALADGAANFCPRNTPYINTIPVNRQHPYPGAPGLEQSLTSLSSFRLS